MIKMETKVVFDFADAISNADVDKIYSLMTHDHLFIDSQDNKMEGRENMKQAWTEYFKWFPDYKIEIEEIYQKDATFCMLGHASGTYKNLHDNDNSNYWRVPAAWKAIITDNQVKHWQVYADNIIVMDIINRNK